MVDSNISVFSLILKICISEILVYVAQYNISVVCFMHILHGQSTTKSLFHDEAHICLLFFVHTYIILLKCILFVVN